MIKAVLLDLDETLLRNPNQGFVPLYLQLVDAYFKQLWGQAISRYLHQSVRHVMTSSRDMEQTNLKLIYEGIQQETQKPYAEIQQAFHNFYTDENLYAALKAVTQKVDGAAQLVKILKDRHYEVIIATNPIYPPEAIHQRLLWAGLSGDFDDYAFVTHAANMHFTKPHPAYYAEILGRVGIEPDEAIMVGDSFDNDILPAACVGLHTCHILPGYLEDFASQIDTLENWLPSPPTPKAISVQLQGNVGALFGLLDSIKPHFWTQHPEPAEWSPLQIVCHLLEREDLVQRPRLERILTEDNPFIVDPGPPLGPRDYAPCDTDGIRVAQRFKQTRQRTIELVEHISESNWDRTARHSIFGPTTLLEMALFTAQHDRLHLKQLCRTVNKCE